jgi:hypothetical protein
VRCSGWAHCAPASISLNGLISLDRCWRCGASWMSPCSLAEDMELELFHVDAGDAMSYSWSEPAVGCWEGGGRLYPPADAEVYVDCRCRG